MRSYLEEIDQNRPPSKLIGLNSDGLNYTTAQIFQKLMADWCLTVTSYESRQSPTNFMTKGKRAPLHL